MTDRAHHIAAAVDGPDMRDLRYFPANPDTTDPLAWAQAFIASGDASPEAIYFWFDNAMRTARYGYDDPDTAEDDDFFPHQTFLRAPRT